MELAVEETVIEGRSLEWEDPVDSSVGWVDVKRVVFHEHFQPDWDIELAAKPPLARGLESGQLIAYGLVLDTNGDSVADYVVGIDNDAPKRGDFHVWVTDLATGETDEQIGPPYGYPIEFSHPDEQEGGTFGFGIEPDQEPPNMAFTFIGGSEPPDLNLETVRWYAWAYATRDGEVFAWDYAPDYGWLTGPTR